MIVFGSEAPVIYWPHNIGHKTHMITHMISTRYGNREYGGKAISAWHDVYVEV